MRTIVPENINEGLSDCRLARVNRSLKRARGPRDAKRNVTRQAGWRGFYRRLGPSLSATPADVSSQAQAAIKEQCDLDSVESALYRKGKELGVLEQAIEIGILDSRHPKYLCVLSEYEALFARSTELRNQIAARPALAPCALLMLPAFVVGNLVEVAPHRMPAKQCPPRTLQWSWSLFRAGLRSRAGSHRTRRARVATTVRATGDPDGGDPEPPGPNSRPTHSAPSGFPSKGRNPVERLSPDQLAQLHGGAL